MSSSLLCFSREPESSPFLWEGQGFSSFLEQAKCFMFYFADFWYLAACISLQSSASLKQHHYCNLPAPYLSTCKYCYIELASISYYKLQLLLIVKSNYFAFMYWLFFVALFLACNIFPSRGMYVIARRKPLNSVYRVSLQTLWVLVHWRLTDKTVKLHLSDHRLWT